MRKVLLCLTIASCGVVSCGNAMSAKDACEKLTKAGFGSNCTKDEPGGVGAAAWENYAFDLTEPKGESCQVLSFKKREDYDATVKAFDAAAALAGPHRYGNPGKLIFVQCNEKMPRDKGAELEKTVSAL